MPFPQRLARFNRRVTNPIARTIAGRFPPFAIVEHRGRRSGATYRTPIMAFRDRGADSYVIALTYGRETDWVRNVLAENGCDLVRRGQRRSLTDPRFVAAADALPILPRPVRPFLRLLGVSDFLRLALADTRSAPVRTLTSVSERVRGDGGDVSAVARVFNPALSEGSRLKPAEDRLIRLGPREGYGVAILRGRFRGTILAPRHRLHGG